MYLTNYKSVVLPLPELIGGIQKLGLSLSMPTQGDAVGGRGWFRSKERWRVPIGSPYIFSSISTRLPESLDCEPPILEKGKPYGVGDSIPFERAFVSSYRPSIVTFPLSLRVSEILPLLFSRTPFFPTTPLVSPKFLHVPPGIGGSPFGYKERRCWADCPCNYFSRFPTYVITNHQRHRQTNNMRSQDRALH